MLLVLIGISGVLRSMNREKAREDQDEDGNERSQRYGQRKGGPLLVERAFCKKKRLLSSAAGRKCLVEMALACYNEA